MKADYKNWMPKGLIAALLAASATGGLCFAVFGAAGWGVGRTARIVWAVAAGTICAICGLLAAQFIGMYRAFSYDGKRQLARQIVEGTARYVELPPGGRGLDVGCGSGALTIACAKRNPQGFMLGIDRWGGEYASYNKPLCERNAAAEGASNVGFARGDALKLDFPDESFDAVTSNYVYHNVRGADKQKLLLETLRVLKKGGVFAIHDLMTPARYGDMRAFADELKRRGYEEVQLLDTTTGMFMSPAEARRLMLKGSALLTGRK
ncbi:class I SAM-dependent methyltransferase [uncultured Pyramidobacter sp.]|uniref:class I SAM-dependent methyltransferase n=1 Tax=uncultured Pyramidobacter sp. TaxID=1623495 RepID=UPI002583959B|nr:class I SAM-dependent methyltransferase [uncultured Pyramidobacter sp.]